jgi:hypothetical protein
VTILNFSVLTNSDAQSSNVAAALAYGIRQPHRLHKSNADKTGPVFTEADALVSAHADARTAMTRLNADYGIGIRPVVYQFGAHDSFRYTIVAVVTDGERMGHATAMHIPIPSHVGIYAHRERVHLHVALANKAAHLQSEPMFRWFTQAQTNDEQQEQFTIGAAIRHLSLFSEALQAALNH